MKYAIDFLTEFTIFYLPIPPASKKIISLHKFWTPGPTPSHSRQMRSTIRFCSAFVRTIFPIAYPPLPSRSPSLPGDDPRGPHPDGPVAFLPRPDAPPSGGIAPSAVDAPPPEAETEIARWDMGDDAARKCSTAAGNGYSK